jgi:hypothetical protein
VIKTAMNDERQMMNVKNAFRASPSIDPRGARVGFTAMLTGVDG